ncbi:3-oxoacyl-ACP synthase [Pseudomonas syringae pv. delphinii]|uniref:3-oxoacyl-ACP synthase n=1 Tax=Pseudomonas syringae pv. delphinii TaxID=192088 RepID=A0A0P9PKW9_9PSED|nr:ketoacyl-ACP synthase III [Pseudomonas syringae group genomosp. 3]KPX18554.1 3-oxoacyl-ACP synthase [Pseudomonas syringae pv. delphinii]RMP16827.1 3-oxoacyl-ACP synthase [Pseudomonas syringae pv. delphinii]RMP26725.1 3-oxoacyl-ACP synthase [Pseudomonas syringae pv. delphinii]RMQ16407.1 3-oxoacyl-ACP synthase [Pseudomonas syringae pv. delphinii]
MLMTSHARIVDIEYELPVHSLDNETLAREFPEWDVDKIFAKTGIGERHIIDENETASDLAYRACEKLFLKGDIQRDEIDALIYCTQSPDYVLPATACILQHRLQLPTTCAAFDFNQGCSGFIYGLGIAKGLIESGQCKNVLLVTAETYSRYIHPQDKSVRTLFGDAAAVTLLRATEGGPFLDRFRYGSDGSGAENLIVPIGGARRPSAENIEPPAYGDDSGNVRTDANLYMNGPAIFEFSMKRVPQLFASLFDDEVGVSDVDLFVFHQANHFMLDALRRRLKLPAEKFVSAFQHCGNTVSCTIPIALKESMDKGVLKPGDRVAAVGFGVGYSWGACVIRW